MPTKNIPVQGSVSGAPLSSSADSYSGQPANPTFRPWPVDTSLPPGTPNFDDVTYNNGNVSSKGNLLPSVLGLASPLLGAGLGFLSNMFGYQNQLDEQLRREEFQKEWRDNERLYNLPAAQIDRLNDAGLNGKLLLSQQGLSQGQTAPQNGNVSPSFDGTGPAAMLAQGGVTAANMLMQQKLMQAQVDNIEAQTSKTQAETMLLPEQLKGFKMSNETYSATQDSIIRKTKLESVNQYLQNILTQSQADIQRQQARIIQEYGMKNADVNSQILQQEYNRILEEITNLRKQGKNIDADTFVKNTAARLNKVLSGYYSAQTEYSKAQTTLTNAQTEQTRYETRTIPRYTNEQLAGLADSMFRHAAAEAGLSELQCMMMENTYKNMPGSPYEYTSFGAALNGWLGSLGQLFGGAAVYSVNSRAGGARAVVKGFKP